MRKFIYVFSTEAKDKLLAGGFKLVQSDEHKNIYVFVSSDGLEFALKDVPFVQTDTLVL